MKRRHPSSGLEGAPDIMLLTMAGLMVAVVWLAAHAQEKTLPSIDLPKSDVAALGLEEDAPIKVTLRPEGSGRDVGVWVDEQRLGGGLAELESALTRARAASVTLRADSGTRWESVLDAMSTAARLDLAVNVAAGP